jgi:hypothetical protein
MTPEVLCQRGDSEWTYLYFDPQGSWRLLEVPLSATRALGTRPALAALEKAAQSSTELAIAEVRALVLEPGTLALYTAEGTLHFGLGLQEVQPLAASLAPRLSELTRDEEPFPRTALGCQAVVEIGVAALLALALFGIASEGGDPSAVSGRRAGAKALLLLLANALGPTGAMVLGGLGVAAAVVHVLWLSRIPHVSIHFTRASEPSAVEALADDAPRNTKDREAARIRGRMRDRLRGLEENRARAREEDGLPARRPEPVLGTSLRDRISADLAERPERGVLVLVLLPVMWPVLLFTGGELRHESWRFRYHDFLVRHPVLGLILSLLGALGAGLALISLLSLSVYFGRNLPWVLW